MHKIAIHTEDGEPMLESNGDPVIVELEDSEYDLINTLAKSKGVSFEEMFVKFLEKAVENHGLQ